MSEHFIKEFPTAASIFASAATLRSRPSVAVFDRRTRRHRRISIKLEIVAVIAVSNRQESKTSGGYVCVTTEFLGKNQSTTTSELNVPAI